MFVDPKSVKALRNALMNTFPRYDASYTRGLLPRCGVAACPDGEASGHAEVGMNAGPAAEGRGQEGGTEGGQVGEDQDGDDTGEVAEVDKRWRRQGCC